LVVDPLRDEVALFGLAQQLAGHPWFTSYA
jgi:hypothetical protein